uniref:Uncharacterized protein n=1 Tax=Tanacetum cinerariifolium TaxID=118510 RepID=A0A6L2PCQ3_TANCI|nr:hypothetical protein [Tanacetum cinerariifolium]
MGDLGDKVYGNEEEGKRSMCEIFKVNEATTKVKSDDGEKHIQALVDKKVIITETSVRSDLHLEDTEDEHVTTTSNDPVLSVKKFKKKVSKKTHKLKRLYKKGSSTRVESSEDACLGDQEDVSKQERMIEDLDADEGVALVDETLGRNDQDMFDTSILDDEEVVAKKEVSTADPVPTAGEVVTTAGVKVSTTAITSQISMDEITLAKALIDIKTSKPKEKGIVMQEPSETPTPTPIDSLQQPLKTKVKGKTKIIEPEKPLKRKDQIMIDEEVSINLEAQMQAELEEEERLARKKKEEANIAFIESWDNTQAIRDADYELAARLQEEEIGELTIEEKSRLFVELMDKRKKYFARLRAEKIRKLVKGSEKAVEGSSKRVEGKLEQEDAKRQRIEDENESAELKRCLEISLDNDDDMFKNFNREDLKVLRSIVKARFKKTKPVDDMDNLLFQTLKIIFEHHVENNI